MRKFQRMACLAATAIAPMLSGCFLISTTRHLPVPKAPAITQTLTPDQLVDRLNKRWADVETMTAKVEIQASVLKAEKGVATDYTTIGGNILFSKPEKLRVLGRAPVVGLKMFDMV